MEDRDPLSGPAHEQKATIHRGETVVGGGGTKIVPRQLSGTFSGIHESIGRCARVGRDPGNDVVVDPTASRAPRSLQQLLGAWRSESWNDAQRLLAASTPAQRAAVARTIEVGAAGRARLIAALTSNLVIGPDAAKRDAYCKQQRSKLH